MTALTDRQIEVLVAIGSATVSKGYPPTVRELRAALGVTSLNTVRDHLDALARKGCVTWDRRVARSVRLTVAAPTMAVLGKPVAVRESERAVATFWPVVREVATGERRAA